MSAYPALPRRSYCEAGCESVALGPYIEKQLNPPTMESSGKPAPVNHSKISGTADHIRPPEEGSIIVIVATDAPLTPDQLNRLARRVTLGLGKAGSREGDESGNLFLAFSTANPGADDGNSPETSFPFKTTNVQRVPRRQMDPIFAAVTQATEEAVDNALVAAKTMTGANY
jgi:D-aminopeptidase